MDITRRSAGPITDNVGAKTTLSRIIRLMKVLPGVAAMAQPTLETVLRRDRAVVAVAIVGLTALAWGYVLWLAADMDMGGMDMSDFRMIPAGTGIMAPSLAPWSGMEFAFVFAMWVVMMIGMMTPSAAPMILIYARLGRQAVVADKPFAATGWFVAGYLLAWVGFALVATAAQWGLDRATLLDSMMASRNNVIGGGVLIAAGIYQWTPLKDVCLAKCQSPFLFIQQLGGFRRDATGAMLLGLYHGAYCVGCCWVLMAMLFVGGVMNVLWIALLALLVLLEKLLVFGRWLARAAGFAFLVAGAWLLSTGII
jgi:predicted metal-binding membrane protein